MQYLIMVCESAAELAKRNDPKEGPAYWGAYKAYSEALIAAGVARGGNVLEVPTAATTVRVRSGKRQVHDGPFADSKEALGGFFVIEVPDLDKALEWAARCPCAVTGSAEVRPVLPPMAATSGAA